MEVWVHLPEALIVMVARGPERHSMPRAGEIIRVNLAEAELEPWAGGDC